MSGETRDGDGGEDMAVLGLWRAMIFLGERELHAETLRKKLILTRKGRVETRELIDSAALAALLKAATSSGEAELVGNSAHRKLLDVLNTVGLSNSVLRLIERRNRVDTWIKFAGMILTFVVLIMLWRWKH
uniref:Uncharacterized protein n=1 Tax=Chenopodium quinoa TaxID=63459 RepID=A0A803MPA6_CHEQI